MPPDSERAGRQQVAQQFEIQLSKLTGYSIKQRLSNYRYVLHDAVQQRDRHAIVLVTSWGFYEHQLYRGSWAVDLLIVQRHTAVVPCYVFDLARGMEYRPGKIPERVRPQRRRRNHEEAMLFVSELLVGVERAQQELAAMPTRTRQYYTALCQRYSRPRRGRPWAS
jgi:hypothetical protein